MAKGCPRVVKCRGQSHWKSVCEGLQENNLPLDLKVSGLSLILINFSKLNPHFLCEILMLPHILCGTVLPGDTALAG